MIVQLLHFIYIWYYVGNKKIFYDSPLQASKSKQILRTITDIFNKGKSKFGHRKTDMKI